MRFAVQTTLLTLLSALTFGCAPSGDVVRDVNGAQIEFNATDFNTHCRDPELAKRLRALGPLYAIGASVSHGIFATSFPDWIRDQMCLSGDAFEDDYFFLFLLKSNSRILDHLSGLRPRLIVAMDFPYHYVKMQYAERAKPILRHYLGMLLMDCHNESIDCSERGDFRFVEKMNFRPIVLTGSVYFDCREDERVDPTEKSFPTMKACREENIKLNEYLYELEREFPNLYVLPVYEMITALHDSDSGVYHYNVNGVQTEFTRSDLFIDGFHPWTNPGTYVLANLVIDWINKHVIKDLDTASFEIPYIPMALDSAPSN